MKKHKSKLWTLKEDDIMKTLYPNATMFELLEWLPGRSERSIYSRAKTLGLLKTKEFRAKQMERIVSNLIESGKATRVKIGNTPPNKGKKQHEYMSQEAIERTKPTRFKKGQMPHNHKPIGHQRITLDGYIEVKVEEPRRFELYHRWLWKIWYGPIPEGYVVGFIDGNPLNCNVENLECYSMKENMLRNSIQRYPEELQDVMRLTGKLKKKIIKRNIENEQ